MLSTVTVRRALRRQPQQPWQHGGRCRPAVVTEALPPGRGRRAARRAPPGDPAQEPAAGEPAAGGQAAAMLGISEGGLRRAAPPVGAPTPAAPPAEEPGAADAMTAAAAQPPGEAPAASTSRAAPRRSSPRVAERAADASQARQAQLAAWQAAGMTPALCARIVEKGRASASSAEGSARLLALFAMLCSEVGLGSAAAANKMLCAASALPLFTATAETIAMKMGVLSQQLGLSKQQLAELLVKEPRLLVMAADDVAPRVLRFTRLLGLSRSETLEWIAGHPAAFCRPTQQPEAHLAALAAALDSDVPSMQRLVRQHTNLIIMSVPALSEKIPALADLLGCDRQTAQRLVLVRPGLLNRSTASLAEVLETVPRLLGVPAAAYRAEAARNTHFLLVPLDAAARRLAFVVKHAQRSDKWWSEWQGMTTGSKVIFLTKSDARLDRLPAVLRVGGDKRFTMNQVLTKTEAEMAALMRELP